MQDNHTQSSAVSSGMLTSIQQHNSHHNVGSSAAHGNAANVGLDGIGGKIMPEVIHGSVEQSIGGISGSPDEFLNSIKTDAAFNGSIADFASKNMLPFAGLETAGIKDFDGSHAVQLENTALPKQSNLSQGSGMSIIDQSHGTGH